MRTVLGTVLGTVPGTGARFAPRLAPLTLGVLLLGACTSPAPTPDPASGVRVAAAAPATPAAPTPASPAEPIAAAPTPAPSPAPEPAAAAPIPCDPTGTWRLAIIEGDMGTCAPIQAATLDLALAFTGDAEAPTLAAAIQHVSGAEAVTGLGAKIWAARVAVPGEGCRLRVVLGAAGSTHAELLLPLADEGLSGTGTLWTKKGGRACRQSFGVLGSRSAAKPGAWAALGAAVAAPPLAAPTPAPPGLAESTATIDAATLLAGAKVRRPTVPLAGSIVDYVAAIVGKPEDVTLHEVGCSGAAASTTAASGCVAIVGNPCRPGTVGEDEDCEGMYLTVVVGPARGALDRADAGGYPVETQADIEGFLEIAP